MRRTPVVLFVTAAGLAGVLTFRTRPASLASGSALSLPSASLPSSSSTSAAPSTTSQLPSTTTVARSPTTTTSNAPTATTVPSTTTTTRPPSTTTTSPRASTSSATGDVVNYSYGTLSVSITLSGSKITNVQIATLDDGGNFRSQSIDQQSLPILEQEALQAQSANIQGVSGASFTSSGFVQSLQSALSKLGK